MILHVILTILKVAGILLLVLILLVLALLLAILFAPIRYRVSVAFTEAKKHGEVTISWLLHLISVNTFMELPPSTKEEASGDRFFEDSSDLDDEKNPLSGLSNLQTGIQIRILGIDPRAAGAYLQKRKRKKTEKKRVKRGQTEKQTAKTRQNRPGGKKKHNHRAEQSEPLQITTQGEGGKSTRQAEKVRQTEQAKLREQKEQPAYEARLKHREASLREEKEKDNQEIPGKKGEQYFGKFNSVLYKLRGLCDKIKQIPKEVRLLAKKGKKLLQKPEQIKKKMNRFIRKAEKYQAREVLLDVWVQVKHMLHHFRVRKGRGYLRFGTGDPALTGELAGVLYLLLPVSCGDLQITPQFTEAVLEAEFEVRGHIRLIHLICIAWRAFFNKKLRRFIRAFRR